MSRSILRSGAAAGALTAICVAQASAQQPLPTIEIGSARRTPSAGVGAGVGAGVRGTTTNEGSTSAARAIDPETYVAPTASTGTKTNTPIMDTPLNVQVVTQQVLRDQQVTSLDQAVANVSGVTVGAGGGFAWGTPYGSIFLRGFRTDTYFRNGVRFDSFGNSPALFNVQFANVESVEVLKGPGAILYGALEPGGIVNINTKQPQSTARYSVQQQIASYDFYRTVASATGPLTGDGSILYRIDSSYQNAKSFLDFGYSRDLFFAPVIKWNIDNKTSVSLELQYDDNHFGQQYGFTPLAYGLPLHQERSLNYGERSPLHDETFFSGLRWSHKFDDQWSVNQQISMYREKAFASQIRPSSIVNRQTFAIGPSIFGPFNVPSSRGLLVSRVASPDHLENDMYSVVTDVTGHFDTWGLKHTLLFGGDYYRYNLSGTITTTSPLTAESLTTLAWPVHPGTPFGLQIPVFAAAGQADNIGLYAQDQIKLPFGFEVLGGVRYQWVNQRTQLTDPRVCGPFATPPFGPPFISTCTQDRLTKQVGEIGRALTPRVGLVWRPYEWVSFYGNYTEGFSPNLNRITRDGKLVPPSQATQWEGGLKLEFFDGRLRATADYYHLVKTNIPTQDASDPTGQSFIVAGEVRSQGPELDIQGEILPGWKVIVAYANTDVIYTKSNEISHPVGSRFETVPRNTGSLWNTYDFQIEELKGFKVGAGYTFHGTQPAWNFSGRLFHQYQLPSYGLVDLMAGYEFKLDTTKITAQLNVTNLLDRHYYSDAEVLRVPTSPFDYQLRTFGTPRTIKGSLVAEF